MSTPLLAVMTPRNRTLSLFASLGAILFGFLVWKLGFKQIWHGIEAAGWTLVAALAINFLSQCTSALGLKWCLYEEGVLVPFRVLWKSRICGEAVNTMTPLGFLGGDPARILILKSSCDGVHSSAGVILDRGIQILSVSFLIIVAAVATSIKIALPRTIEWAVAAVVIAALLAVFFLFRIWEIGPVRTLRVITRPLLPEVIASQIDWPKLLETDRKIQSFAQHDRRHFWYALGWHLMTRILGIAEIWIIGTILSHRFDLLGALILSGLTPAIGFLFAIFPGAVGILEGGYSATFYLMGLSPALGVSLQIIRRIRGLAWSAVGLALMGNLRRYRPSPSTDPAVS